MFTIKTTLSRALGTYVVCAAIVLSFALSACGITLDRAKHARDDAAHLVASADERIIDLTRLANALPEGSPEQLDAQRRLDEWVARRSVLDGLVTQADEILAEAANPTDGLTRSATLISEWLPAPAGPPLVLGAALLATLARARQLKRGSASIAQSLERAMDNDPALRELVASQADTFRSIQTPTAKRIVDETTSDRRMLKLPI